MIINKAKLCNFGSFENEIEFDISVNDDKKNVILIGGRNGSGKTTLFTAIKLALYGYTSFGYQSANSSYFSAIKKLLNKNSIGKKDVNSYVFIDFNLEEERSIANYQINRKWKYENKRLSEEYSVSRDGLILDEDQTISFESYLKSIIPPQLFDLFFFDGEKISDFFLEGNSAKNLKDAFLVLCGYDSFDIIRANLKRASHFDISDSSEQKNIYETLYNNRIDTLKSVEYENDKLTSIEKEISQLAEQKIELEKSFRKSGGMLSEEIIQIKNKILYEEKLREEINSSLKDFANDFLPFLIVKDLVSSVDKQVNMEMDYKKYKVIKEILSEDFLTTIVNEEIESNNIKIEDIKGNFSDKFPKLLLNRIKQGIKPNFDVDNFEVIHSLSQDEEFEVLSLIKQINKQDNGIVTKYNKEITSSISRSNKLKKKLEQAENNDQLSIYIEKIKLVDDTINKLTFEKGKITDYIANLEKSVSEIDTNLSKAKENLTKSRKQNSIIKLAENASKMMENFIPVLVDRKLGLLKDNFLAMFKCLIEKPNFIDDIDIDSNFNITLYRTGIITKSELETMISKFGIEGLLNHLGEKSIDVLLKEFCVSKKEELENVIKTFKIGDFIPINIPIKVDVNGFSKGEQQIFIMSLYWALIKLSINKIPFIIDTPYARIDALHRKNITTQFFPSLSNQVLILSTDEEIDNQYYKLIKPHTAHEYTIEYSNSDKRTIVKDKYFFEVTL